MALVQISTLIIFMVIVMSKKNKNELNIWMGIFVTFSIFGVFGVFLKELNKEGFIKTAAGILDTASYYLAPYSFFMLGITYLYVESPKYKKIVIKIGALAFIPTAALYIFYPPIPFRPNFLYVSLYGCMYYFGGVFLQILSVLKEKRLLFRKQKFVFLLIITPGVVAEVIVSFIFPALGLPNYQIINQIGAVIMFVFFCITLVKYGFMGIIVRFEGLNVTMKNISTGTEIFNHTVKNEMNIISAGLYTVKSAIKDNKEAAEAVEVIEKSIRHMKEMAKRVRHNSQEICLCREKNDIVSLLDNTLKRIVCHQNKKISIVKLYDMKYAMIFVDRVYMEEVFQNIIINAMESFENQIEATIKVSLGKSYKSIVIRITDNGKGIPKHMLSHVFDPFFSSKSSKDNFGLGLTFCYNVLKMHEGLIDIESKEDEGTTVSIILPIKS